jgi:UDP-glucose 4-epimerase
MYGIKYTILRFFNIYGGTHGKGVINIFFNKAMAGENLTITGDGSQHRDFLYIDDAIEAYLKALEKKAENQIFNIGSGRKTTIKELAEQITNMVGSKSRIEHLPQRDVSPLYPVANYGRARIMVGFEPKIGLEEGLKLMFNKLK